MKLNNFRKGLAKFTLASLVLASTLGCKPKEGNNVDLTKYSWSRMVFVSELSNYPSKGDTTQFCDLDSDYKHVDYIILNHHIMRRDNTNFSRYVSDFESIKRKTKCNTH